MQYFTVKCCLFFDFTRFVILENLSVLHLALSEVMGLIIYLQELPAPLLRAKYKESNNNVT